MILRLLIQTVSAAGLADVGAGYANNMWKDVCTMLPFCGQGAQGIQIATGVVIRTILWAAGSAAVVIILYGAIRMTISGGNEENVRKAWKEIILYAGIGLVLVILADTIVSYVWNFVTTASSL